MITPVKDNKKWYKGTLFPLIPVIEIKKADKHNTSSMYFHWLFLKLWTLDVPDFEVSFVISLHWGIGFVGTLPYLRWVFTIPCPPTVEMWNFKHLSRKPKR